MKNFMMRSIDIANILGLLCGAIAIFVLGYEMNNKIILSFATASLTIFTIFLLLNIFLLLRDFIKYGWSGIMHLNFY